MQGPGWRGGGLQRQGERAKWKEEDEVKIPLGISRLSPRTLRRVKAAHRSPFTEPLLLEPCGGESKWKSGP